MSTLPSKADMSRARPLNAAIAAIQSDRSDADRQLDFSAAYQLRYVESAGNLAWRFETAVITAASVGHSPSITREGFLDPLPLGLSQTSASQQLDDFAGRTIVRQLAVDHDCRNATNAQLLGAGEDTTVQRTLHDDVARWTGRLLARGVRLM
jgi:hypothetical protein